MTIIGLIKKILKILLHHNGKKACWIWLNKTRRNLILWSEKMPSEAEKELFKRTQLQKIYFNLEIKIVMEEWGCGTVIQEKQVQNLCEC